MTNQLALLSAILLVSAVLSLLYSVLDLEKAKRLNIWFHLLAGKRPTYDFEAMCKRTRFVYYYFTLISALGIILSLINQSLGELFVWVSFISLVVSLYYLYPVKVKSL